MSDTVVNRGFQTIEEFTEAQGITRRTVYHWIDKGKVEVKKLYNTTLVKLKV